MTSDSRTSRQKHKMTSTDKKLEIPSAVSQHVTVLNEEVSFGNVKSKLCSWNLMLKSPNDPSGMEGIAKCLKKVKPSILITQ